MAALSLVGSEPHKGITLTVRSQPMEKCHFSNWDQPRQKPLKAWPLFPNSPAGAWVCPSMRYDFARPVRRRLVIKGRCVAWTVGPHGQKKPNLEYMWRLWNGYRAGRGKDADAGKAPGLNLGSEAGVQVLPGKGSLVFQCAGSQRERPCSLTDYLLPPA